MMDEYDINNHWIQNIPMPKIQIVERGRAVAKSKMEPFISLPGPGGRGANKILRRRRRPQGGHPGIQDDMQALQKKLRDDLLRSARFRMRAVRKRHGGIRIQTLLVGCQNWWWKDNMNKLGVG